MSRAAFAVWSILIVLGYAGLGFAIGMNYCP